MPELPEVETIALDLKKKVLQRTFIDLWIQDPSIIHHPSNTRDFKKQILGKTILDVQRRAKNILFFLNKDCVLLIHLKMTGHLLVGKWEFKNNQWVPLQKGALQDDPINKFLRIIFTLDNQEQLALSDLRRFAKLELWKKDVLFSSKKFRTLGPEPLDPNFTFNKFCQLFQKKRGCLKLVLMDQNFIAGIGNIYASEILFEARLHPETRVEHLTLEDLKRLYGAIRNVLVKGIAARGASISDYRDIQGNKGNYQKIIQVYGREGECCPVCGAKIKRITLGGRGTFYCPVCQIKK
ncbi:MAG TPA: DNA-formamidopyrimidine glycosylase [Candidatus Pacearchaeota archaeon]|jgi:formamidopyrimidine-DNA glycosylase|nr:DNA-formamidopyrimidine glycosylase [Candidatus Pacearchaeota archaeon]HRR94833.1 DNA-formamidopyrimidine glycosylase [Candidatus Paceibacterota bacterium]HPC30618.1 DNA-formamidopyrimidine glycosylase [Candidatus Pacearchaeota archaeon]HQG09362.1 DNA-formamidopyrimidine glycosylase [Candidatus Pacearchaeota archaeon]HQH20231.1 DNA-formamidopyrimidine glycosylase [Candidatus Pacearchaeota archaeon]